jgi:hypothetical protein
VRFSTNIELYIKVYFHFWFPALHVFFVEPRHMINIGVGLFVPGTSFIIHRSRSKLPPYLFALHDVQAIARSFSTNLGCQHEMFFVLMTVFTT